MRRGALGCTGVSLGPTLQVQGALGCVGEEWVLMGPVTSLNTSLLLLLLLLMPDFLEAVDDHTFLNKVPPFPLFWHSTKEKFHVATSLKVRVSTGYTFAEVPQQGGHLRKQSNL